MNMCIEMWKVQGLNKLCPGVGGGGLIYFICKSLLLVLLLILLGQHE